MDNLLKIKRNLLLEFQSLVKSEEVSISDSLSLVTSNVSDNLGLHHKGRVKVGADADFCVFNDSWELQNVIAMGEMISLE